MATNNQFLTQDDFTFTENSEAGDEFGAALASNNLNQDTNTTAFGTFPVDDLVVGTPLEDLPDFTGANQIDAGMVNLVLGSPSGLVRSANVLDVRRLLWR